MMKSAAVLMGALLAILLGVCEAFMAPPVFLGGRMGGRGLVLRSRRAGVAVVSSEIVVFVLR